MDELEILTERVLTEFSDEQYETLKTYYNDKRLIMTKNSEINFNGPVTRNNSRMGKPNGLWYGAGTEWIDWVMSNAPQWRQQHVFEILPNYSTIKRITNSKEMVEFNNEYSHLLEPDEKYKFRQIDWINVAQNYDGIEIAPYIYDSEVRHNQEFFWYWGWDVASGCIWNKNAISDIKRIF